MIAYPSKLMFYSFSDKAYFECCRKEGGRVLRDQDDPVEKVEFGLGLKRRDGFGKATKKTNSRPGSIPWRQKGWEVM